MIERFSKRRDEKGFTLIELLVVIVILGVLSAVVVFAVRGAGDKGQSSALKIDARTVRTAEEAFCAKTGGYGTIDQLTGAAPAADGQTYKFLSEKPTLSDVALVPGGPCNGSGDDTKSGFITGYKEPNGGSPPASSGYPELKLAVSGAGAGLYPNPFQWGFSGPSQAQMNLMFDPLVWKDATGQVIPWLATDVPSFANGGITNGGLTYTFNLRSGMTWQDGVPFTAADVKFTVDYQNTGGAANSVTPCWCKTALTNISSVVVNNPTSVTFNLIAARPNTFFQDVGWGMVIVPQHIWSGITTTSTPYSLSNMHTEPTGKGYVGTGPYKLLNPSSYVPSGGSCAGCSQYDANTSFFLGTPYVRKLTYVIPGSGITGLLNKVIDAGGVGSNEGIDQATFNQLSGLDRATAPGGGNTVVFFNSNKGFPYNNVKFRQAIAYALDRKFLLDSLAGGRGQVSSMGSLAPSHPMLAPGLPTYDLGSRAANIAKANQLLDEIGITDGADGDILRECNGTPCVIVTPPAGTVTSSSGAGVNFTPALYRGSTVAAYNTAITSNLADIGLGLFSPAPTDSSFAAQSRASAGNYGIMLVGFGNTTQEPDILRVRLSSTYTASTPSFWNIYGWNNTANATAFMALADQQLTETNPTTRKGQIQQLQRYVADDVPQISLFTADVWFFWQPGTFSAWYNTPGGTPPGPPAFTNKHVWVTGKQFGLPTGF